MVPLMYQRYHVDRDVSVEAMDMPTWVVDWLELIIVDFVVDVMMYL